ncbi:hypothetical protein [Vibrio splendidus]|uniref:hypothetical protein n=1 Tax=Vibrio splendidus TaxID=29497 RepID=UPI000C838497|nr:hypothetical protein [Vibrio splendidus]PMI25546.1 hypothetical protein BCU48_23310 [Vibrio splendidus]
MTHYPVLTCYPIRTCISRPFPPWLGDCIEWLDIHDIHTHLSRVIEFGNDNGLRNELFDKYSSLFSQFEFIKNIGNKAHLNSSLYTFRHTPINANPWAVTLSIAKLGLYLPSGQLLLHGGGFEQLCHKIGEQYVTELPLSTTLCPEIAVYFSDRHMDGYLGEIQVISVTEQAKTKAVILTNKPDLDMKHEMEVLVEAGAKLVYDSEYYINGVGQRQYKISHLRLV